MARRILPDICEVTKVDDQNLPPCPPKKINKKSSEHEISDKIEIDSDNIETPPATRKILGLNIRNNEERVIPPPTRCSRLSKEDDTKDEEETLGDGQFDRFSSARRTRRYRKITDEDNSKKTEASPPSAELVPEKQVMRQDAQKAQSYPIASHRSEDSESRLKKWQDRLKYREPKKETNEESPGANEEQGKSHRSSTLPKSFRHGGSGEIKGSSDAVEKTTKEIRPEIREVRAPKKIDPAHMAPGSSLTLPRNFRRKTMIDSNDVLMASRGQRNDDRPNSTNKNFSSLSTSSNSHSQVKSTFVPEIKVQATIPKSRTDTEMKDEGFEETQSLASEPTSLGASSGYNNEDTVDSTVRTRNEPPAKLSRADSSGSGDTSSGIQVRRSNSVRHPSSQERRSIIPKRSTSLKKTESQASVTRQQIKGRIEPPPVQRRILSLTNRRVEQDDSKRTVQKNTVDKKTDTPASGLRRPLSSDKLSKSKLHCALPTKPKRSSSKSSLRSSRSSLNSSASVSTVRNIKPVGSGINNYTRAIKSLTSGLQGQMNKRPLGPSQIRGKPTAPASRSSSSGSSIGPVISRPKISSGINTSFKENSVNPVVPASRSSSSGSSVGSPLKKAGLNFMRPTASSAAKDTLDPIRFRSTLRSIK